MKAERTTDVTASPSRCCEHVAWAASARVGYVERPYEDGGAGWDVLGGAKEPTAKVRIVLMAVQSFLS